MQLPLPMAAAEICRQESSPPGLAQVFPCSSRIPSSCPLSYQLVSASSWRTMPIPRWDHHLPHPIACASVNAAKRTESNQLCRACQEHRDFKPHLSFGPWGNCPLGAFGVSSRSETLPALLLHPNPVWPKVRTTFSISSCLIPLTLTHAHLHTLTPH